MNRGGEGTTRLRVLLLGILGGACVLRLIRLGVKSFWTDEAYSVFVGSAPLSQVVETIRTFDPHPPLYFVLLHVWLRAGGNGESWVRLLSVLGGVTAVGLTYLLGRRVLGQREGLLGAGLAAFSPFAVMASQDARMYPLLTVWGLGSSYLFWLAVEEGDRRRHWAMYAVVNALAMYTHYFGVLFPLAHLGYLAWTRQPWRVLRRWLLTVGATGVLLLPWLPAVVQQIVSGLGWPAFRGGVDEHTLLILLTLLGFGGTLFDMPSYLAGGRASPLTHLLVALPVVGLFAAGLGEIRRRPRPVGFLVWILAVPILVPFLVALHWLPVFVTRYFSFQAPAFVLLLSAGITRLSGVIPRVPARVATAGAVLLMAAYSAPVLASFYYDPRLAVTDWRAAARHVAAHATPGDLVLVVHHAATPFFHYFKGSQPRRVVYVWELAPEAWLRSPRLPESIRRRLREPPFDGVEAARHARRVPYAWVVMREPVPPRALMALDEALRQSFTLVSRVDFRGVDIYRLKSRYQPAATPGSP
ncbi:MAG: glycosyltransferase family 39 protein [Armatimonadetes bacterium]|nr:glycosyltransferase family 39 protein [Armatimonadota bacterium]